MIKSKKNKVTIEGDSLNLMVEFTHIVNSLKNAMLENGVCEEVAKELLDKAYHLGCMSEDDIQKEFIKTILEVCSNEEEEKGNE